MVHTAAAVVRLNRRRVIRTTGVLRLSALSHLLLPHARQSVLLAPRRKPLLLQQATARFDAHEVEGRRAALARAAQRRARLLAVRAAKLLRTSDRLGHVDQLVVLVQVRLGAPLRAVGVEALSLELPQGSLARALFQAQLARRRLFDPVAGAARGEGVLVEHATARLHALEVERPAAALPQALERRAGRVAVRAPEL